MEEHTYFKHFFIHAEQNRCPHFVKTGSRRYKKHIAHSKLS